MIIDTRMRPMYGAFAEQFTPEACAPFCRKIWHGYAGVRQDDGFRKGHA